MTKRDIIVVGASAGGVTALKSFVAFLPEDYRSCVFIVLHIPPFTKSELASILTKAIPLKAKQPRDGEDIQPGIIYVAANDHLLLENGKVIIKKNISDPKLAICEILKKDEAGLNKRQERVEFILMKESDNMDREGC